MTLSLSFSCSFLFLITVWCMQKLKQVLFVGIFCHAQMVLSHHSCFVFGEHPLETLPLTMEMLHQSGQGRLSFGLSTEY